MKYITTPLLALAILLIAGCASAPPPPAPIVEGEDRYLIDPRIGYERPATPSVERKFDDAWRAFQSGQDATARMQFDQLRARVSGYAPADLAPAAIDIREKKFDAARTLVDRILEKQPGYLAAQVYQAEIAYRLSDFRTAFGLYSQLASRADSSPTIRERTGEARQHLLDEINGAAMAATPSSAIPLLREALTIDPGARPTRMLLVHNLLTQKKWDAARTALDPLLGNEADKADVQEALGEIEIGRGQYEQAISRYERLARRESDPRFAQRLEQIKQEWSNSNMPPQFMKAAETDAVTRADVAVLLFWTIPSIRFAQNLASPPIAVDIAEVTGRDEVIRAIAIGMLQVDPVTRRVNPNALVSTSQLTRYMSKVLVNRGSACARRSSSNDSVKVLAACGISDLSSEMSPDAAVTGAAASTVIHQVGQALTAP